MHREIVVIEDMSAQAPHPPSAVAALFGADGWLRSVTSGGALTVHETDGVKLPPALSARTGILNFYHALFGLLGRDATIYRVRRPDYPLHERQSREIREQFPPDRHGYVLSLAEECGLTGYSVERLSADAVEELNNLPYSLSNQSYFNGMAIRGGARHWFSLELRSFYLDDCFEILFDSPRYISMNIIGMCNYTCRKCQFHSPLNTTKQEFRQIMPMERFEALLDLAMEYPRLKGIFPSITGEPLLHPNIVEIVRKIKGHGYNCSFTTNAFLLTPQLTDRLIDAGIDQIAISIDTLDPDKYKRLQAGGDLGIVESNIKIFRDRYYARHGRFDAAINCVIDESNVGEQEAFRRKWLNEGFHVALSTKYDFLNRNTPYFVNSKWGPESRQPCWALWTGLYLTHEGRVVSCGSMAKTLGLKDNLFDTPPYALWRSAALTKLRKQQLTGVRPGYCQQFNCWTGMTNTSIADDSGERMYNLGGTCYFSSKSAGSWPRKFDDRLFSLLRPAARFVGFVS